MNDVSFAVLYNSLGLVLENLQAEPEIKASESLRSKLENARAFHKAMEDEYHGLIATNKRLGKELGAMQPKTIDSEDIGEYIKKYMVFREAGATPRVIYEIAKSDGARDKITYLKILSNVFELSGKDAQEILKQFEAE